MNNNIEQNVEQMRQQYIADISIKTVGMKSLI